MKTSSCPDPEGLWFEVLGPLRVVREGQPVKLGGPRQRAVLARLLVDRGHPVSRDGLADAVWSGDPPPGYVTTLQTYVFHLRSALEPDRDRRQPATILVSEPNGYRLAVAADRIDATAFEASVATAALLLREGRSLQARRAVDAALALWRGAPLTDIAALPFLTPLVTRLEELRLSAIEIGLDADLRAGRHDRVLVESAEVIAAHPLREHVHEQRMLALYRSGRQADALTTYLDLRRALVTQLGVEPSHQLRDLQYRILSHDFSLDLPAAAARAATTGRPAGRSPAFTAAAMLAAGTVAVIRALHHRQRLFSPHSAAPTRRRQLARYG